MQQNLHDIPEASWLFVFAVRAFVWLNPIVYLIGLCVAIWAFIRCRKCGYLMLAAYFTLVIFWLFVWPPIERALPHQPPDISTQIQQKIDAAVLAATQKVLAEEGHPEGIPHRVTIHFPFGPILLVVGLWLVARRESHRATPP